MSKEIIINNNKIYRKFTKDWADTGDVGFESMSKLLISLRTQRNSMVDYIEVLHDKIDKLIVEINKK